MLDYSNINSVLQRTHNVMDEHQRDMVGKGRSSGYLGVSAWMGTGKTLVSLTTVLCYKPRRVLIICPKNAIGTFKTQLKEWFPEYADPVVVVSGNEGQRWERYQSKNTWFITTGGAFLRDYTWLMRQGIYFDAIITDESKRLGFSNRTSVTWKAFKTYTSKPNRPKIIVQMGGKLSGIGPQQYWPYLHIANPQAFRGFWPFVHEYHVVANGPFGKDIGPPQNTDNFARLISPYIYIITKKQAEASLPEMRRQKLTTQIDPKIIDMYNSMAESLWMELPNGELDFVSTPLAGMSRLRKLICCPKIIDPSLPIGTPIEICVDKMRDLKDDNSHWRHNIVATPFVESIDYFREYLSAELSLPLRKILVLRGGMDPTEVIEVEAEYRSDPQTLALLSLAFAQSYNLETCLNCYLPHFDWDPEANEQTEARGRRKTSDRTRIYNAFYVDVEYSITGNMFERMSHKEHLHRLSNDAVMRLRETLKRGIKKENLDPT